MITQRLPARAARALGSPTLRSRSLFRWQAKRETLNAIGGQVGTLVRASTSTAIDRNGATITVGYGRPRKEWRDYYGLSGVRDTMGVRLSTDDLYWQYRGFPGEQTMLVEAVELGTRAAGGGLVYIGNDAQTGARLAIDSDGTYYRALLHNGTTSETVTLADAVPLLNNSFAVLHQIDESDDGTQIRHKLLIKELCMPGFKETAWSSFIDKPAAWGAGFLVRANRKGSLGTQGDTWIRQIAIEPGILTLSQIIERL